MADTTRQARSARSGPPTDDGVKRRIELMLALPPTTLDKPGIQHGIKDIGTH